MWLCLCCNQGGEIWVMNPGQESLAFTLARAGYQVWIGNTRSSKYTFGHITFQRQDKVSSSVPQSLFLSLQNLPSMNGSESSPWCCHLCISMPWIPFLVKELELSVHRILIISTLLNQALMILLEFRRSSSSSHFSYSAGISLWFSEAINVNEHENKHWDA